MTNKINYDIMSIDIIEDAMAEMGYSLSQVLYSVMAYCERREVKVTKQDLFDGDPEKFYGIISKAMGEESENGIWKKR